RPLVLLMNGTGNAILRRCGYRPAGAEGSVHSVAELALLIEDSQDSGVLSPQQAELVQKVFRLSGKKVKDCLVPRERMAGLGRRPRGGGGGGAGRGGPHRRVRVRGGGGNGGGASATTKPLPPLCGGGGVGVRGPPLPPPLFLEPEQDVGAALELFRRSRRPMA